MIDAENTLFIAVAAASFVRQFHDEWDRTTSPPRDADRMMEEALSVAETAVASYARVFIPKR